MVCVKNIALSTALLLSAAESTLAAPTAYDSLALRSEAGAENSLEARQFGAIASVFKNIGRGKGAKAGKHNNKKDKSGTVVGHTKNGGKIIGGVLGRDVDLETRQFGAIASVFKNIGRGKGAKAGKHNNKKDKSGTVVGHTKNGGKIIGGVLGRDLEEREEASYVDFVERDESEDLDERDFDIEDLLERDLESDDLVERDLELEDLVVRDSEWEDLAERDFELEELLERDFESEDLTERDFDFEDLYE